ncbi:MAG: hypothetical protein KGN16_16220 [Burkholderiales bacterium]|nr:hypothetical protein [Burkholderiales bacterium]
MDASPMIDLVYALSGSELAREHQRALAAAVAARLPWLAQEPRAGIGRLNLSDGGPGRALLSHRTELTLRLPRERAAAARDLVGAELAVGAARLQVRGMRARELRPHGTLYAPLVLAGDVAKATEAAEGGAGAVDEVAFMAAVRRELDALDVDCRAICGRRGAVDGLRGHSLMLDGLGTAAALRVLEVGIGPQRLFGCGFFVPHKSAAAVGVHA